MAFAFTSSTLNHLHLLLLSLLIVTVFFPLCSAKCHPDDEAGLLAFKSGITKDPLGLLNTWIPGTDCCSWMNIGCSKSNRINELYLVADDEEDPPVSLTGTISPLLFIKVKQLSTIRFQNHLNLTGSLPKEIFNLLRLNSLTIRITNLSGLLVIDDTGPKSDRLELLSLVDNKFTGSIPNSISRFTSLTGLELIQNKFTGKIPNDIQHLTKLTDFSLGNNQLTGVIPDFFNSFQLTLLDLSQNKLSGEIPPSVSSLAPQLVILRIDHNKLTGRIPDSLKNFKKLFALNLSFNRLSGPIPKTKTNFSADAFEGNAGLCGSPLPPCKKAS